MRNPRQNVDGGYETVRHGLSFHQLRHRNIADAHWVEVHLIFPKRVSLEEAHRTATAIERTVEEALEPRAYLTTHPNARRAMMNFIQTAIVEKQVERAAASADEHVRRSAKGTGRILNGFVRRYLQRILSQDWGNPRSGIEGARENSG